MSTKLGSHILAGNTAARILAEAGSRFQVQVDAFDPTYADYAGMTIIGRRVSTYPQDPGRPVTAENLTNHPPDEAAQIWIDIQTPIYLANPFIKIWCGPNEPDFGNSVHLMAWYGTFEAERIRLLVAMGMRAAIGCFSYGTPDIGEAKLDIWQAFIPALRAALEHGGILSLHEYNADSLVSSPDQQSRPQPLDVNGEGWLTFRYRKVHRLILVPHGLGDLPIALTEFARFNWRERLSAMEYTANLIAADAELSKDSYLLGAAIFTCGTNNQQAWGSFNIDGTEVPNMLGRYIRNLPAPTPTPTPAPTPAPGGTSMAISINDLDLTKFYSWDTQPGAPEFGDTLKVPVGMAFDYVYDKTVRVRFKDIKPGSPTLGQQRVSDDDFNKPESHFLLQQDARDIPFGVLLAAQKTFKGWSPIWFVYSVALRLTAGSKVRATWPVWPNILVSDDAGKKIYSDDPAAGWVRLRVKAGESIMKVDPVNGAPDSSWYNGRDFAFGAWITPQVVIDVTDPSGIMTLGLECCSIFGVKDSDFIFGTPTLEVIQTAPGGNPGSTNPLPVAAGTVRAAVAAIVEAANGADAGVQTMKSAAGALNALIG